MSRKIYISIAVVLTVVLSVSTFFIIRNHIDSAKQSEVYDNLAEIVKDEPPKENEGVTFSEDKDYLAEYLELCRQNEDMVGWIKVEDTNINYPVVQSVNEPAQNALHLQEKPDIHSRFPVSGRKRCAWRGICCGKQDFPADR